MLGHEAAATLYRARPGLTAQRPAIDQDPSAWICRFEYEPQAPDDTTVGVISTTVAMPLRADLGDHAALEADAQRLLGDLHEAEDRDLRDAGRISPATRDLTAQTKWAIMLSERRRFVACDDRLDMELHGVRLGPLAVLGAPVEPFVELGLSLEAASPFAATMAAAMPTATTSTCPRPPRTLRAGTSPRSPRSRPKAANVYVDAQAALLSSLVALG